MWWPPYWNPVTSPRRALSEVPQKSPALYLVWGSRWNRVAYSFRWIVIFHFWYPWRPSWISVVCHRRPTSSNVLSVKSMSGVVKNLAVAFGIASQSSRVQMAFKRCLQFWFGDRHLESVVNNVRKRFCHVMEGVLSFPGLSRYKEELQPLSEKRGMGFFFFYSHGLQKYLKRTEVVQICLISQALTRCSLLMPNGIKIKWTGFTQWHVH